MTVSPPRRSHLCRPGPRLVGGMQTVDLLGNMGLLVMAASNHQRGHSTHRVLRGHKLRPSPNSLAKLHHGAILPSALHSRSTSVPSWSNLVRCPTTLPYTPMLLSPVPLGNCRGHPFRIRFSPRRPTASDSEMTTSLGMSMAANQNVRNQTLHASMKPREHHMHASISSCGT